MGEGVAVDCAVGVRRKVHRRDDVAGENAPRGAAQRCSLRFDDRTDPDLDLRQRVLDAEQRAAKGKAVITQLRHRPSPVFSRIKPAITAASDSGRNGILNSAHRLSAAIATTKGSSVCNNVFPSAWR